MIIIAVGGQQAAGKTTFCAILRDLLQWPSFNTSEILQAVTAKRLGVTVKEIEGNKHLYRQALIDEGARREEIEPIGLIKACIRDGQFLFPRRNLIIESVRRKSEVEYLQGIPIVKLVLIEAERDVRASRRPLMCEDDITEVEGYQALMENPNVHRIDNNGTLEELAQQALEFATPWL